MYDNLKIEEIANGPKYYRARIEALEDSLAHEQRARENENIYKDTRIQELEAALFLQPA